MPQGERQAPRGKLRRGMPSRAGGVLEPVNNSLPPSMRVEASPLGSPHHPLAAPVPMKRYTAQRRPHTETAQRRPGPTHQERARTAQTNPYQSTPLEADGREVGAITGATTITISEW